MPAPPWLAATLSTPASPTRAGQVNQFLATHAVNYIYAATRQAAQTVAGTGVVSSNGLYVAQSFATAAGQTTVGRLALTFAVTGAPLPLAVSLYANSLGAPSGSPIVTTLVPKEFLSGTASVVTIPLPASGLAAAATYWIVAQANGDASNYYTWSQSNQTSGASTSPTGATWTAQTYGLLHQVFDQSGVGPLTATWEDGGARWTAYAFDTIGRPNIIAEYTAGQTPAGYLTSLRNLTYTTGQLTGIA